MVVTALLYWLLLSLRGTLTVDSWLGLIFFGGLSVVGVALVAFFAGLSREQRNRIWARTRMVIR
jgi:hypothetical protein